MNVIEYEIYPFSALLRTIYNADEARHWRHPDNHMDLQPKDEPKSWKTRTMEGKKQPDAVMQANTNFSQDKVDKTFQGGHNNAEMETTSRINNVDMKTRDGQIKSFKPYIHKRHTGSFELTRPFQGQNSWQKSDTRASDTIGMRSFDGENDWHKSEARIFNQIDALHSYDNHEPGWSSDNSLKATPFQGQSAWQITDTKASDNTNTRSFVGQKERGTSCQIDAARCYDHPEPGWSSETSVKARSFQEQNGWQISDRKSTDKINTADPYASHQTQLSSAHWK